MSCGTRRALFLPRSVAPTPPGRMSSGVELQPMQSSAFVRPYSIMYQLDGRKRRWDAVESHPSVACVLLHKGLDSLIMVRQFRPAVSGT